MAPGVVLHLRYLGERLHRDPSHVEQRGDVVLVDDVLGPGEAMGETTDAAVAVIGGDGGEPAIRWHASRRHRRQAPARSGRRIVGSDIGASNAGTPGRRVGVEADRQRRVRQVSTWW